MSTTGAPWRLVPSLAAALLALALAAPVDAAALSVRFVSLPTTPRGGTAKATVKAPAGARCTILVQYKTGPSKAKGLGPKLVPASGTVVWTWTVARNTTRGAWPVTVSCKKGSATGTATKKLVVT